MDDHEFLRAESVFLIPSSSGLSMRVGFNRKRYEDLQRCYHTEDVVGGSSALKLSVIKHSTEDISRYLPLDIASKRMELDSVIADAAAGEEACLDAELELTITLQNLPSAPWRKNTVLKACVVDGASRHASFVGLLAKASGATSTNCMLAYTPADPRELRFDSLYMLRFTIPVLLSSKESTAMTPRFLLRLFRSYMRHYLEQFEMTPTFLELKAPHVVVADFRGWCSHELRLNAMQNVCDMAAVVRLAQAIAPDKVARALDRAIFFGETYCRWNSQTDTSIKHVCSYPCTPFLSLLSIEAATGGMEFESQQFMPGFTSTAQPAINISLRLGLISLLRGMDGKLSRGLLLIPLYSLSARKPILDTTRVLARLYSKLVAAYAPKAVSFDNGVSTCIDFLASNLTLQPAAGIAGTAAMLVLGQGVFFWHLPPATAVTGEPVAIAWKGLGVEERFGNVVARQTLCDKAFMKRVGSLNNWSLKVPRALEMVSNTATFPNGAELHVGLDQYDIAKNWFTGKSTAA